MTEEERKTAIEEVKKMRKVIEALADGRMMRKIGQRWEELPTTSLEWHYNEEHWLIGVINVKSACPRNQE